MTICEDREDRLVLWEKGLASDKSSPLGRQGKEMDSFHRTDAGHPGEGVAGVSCCRIQGSEAWDGAGAASPRDSGSVARAGAGAQQLRGMRPRGP